MNGPVFLTRFAQFNDLGFCKMSTYVVSGGTGLYIHFTAWNDEDDFLFEKVFHWDFALGD